MLGQLHCDCGGARPEIPNPNVTCQPARPEMPVVKPGGEGAQWFANNSVGCTKTAEKLRHVSDRRRIDPAGDKENGSDTIQPVIARAISFHCHQPCTTKRCARSGLLYCDGYDALPTS